MPQIIGNVAVYNSVEYRNGVISHSEYYGQFINAYCREYVARMIGKEKIINSTNPHFNDIPLELWDKLCMKSLINGKAWRYAASQGYTPDCNGKFMWSISDNVCLAKEAARQIKELSKSN